MGTFISLSLSASVVRSWLSTESTGPARHGKASFDHSRAKGGAAPSGACGPQWAGSMPEESDSLCRKPCDRRKTGAGLPEPKAPSSLASAAG